MRVLSVLLLFLALAGPARADWLAHEPAASYPDGGRGAVAVAGDGTIISGDQTLEGATELRIGGVTRFVTGTNPLVAAGGDHELSAAWDGADGEVRVMVGLGDPVVIGPGVLGGLAADAAGDMAVLVNGPTHLQIAFRPAGGAFGPLVDTGLDHVPGGDLANAFLESTHPFALSLDAAGDALVARADTDLRVASVTRAGVASPPVVVAPAGSVPASSIDPVLGQDAHGRALAVWGQAKAPGFAVRAAYRDTDGAWHATTGIDGDSNSGFRPALGVDAAGDALVGWWDRPDNALLVAQGSLADGHFRTDGFAIAGVPTIAMRPDGSAIVATADTATVHTIRRDGTGPFGPIGVAGCGKGVVAGGFDAGGRGVLGFTGQSSAWTTVREGQPDAPIPYACKDDNPNATVTVDSGPYFDEPLAVTLQPQTPGDTVASVDWDFDGVPGFEQHTDGPTITHVFSRDGHELFVRYVEQAPDGTQTTNVGAVFGPALLTRISLGVPRQSLRAILHHGLRVAVSTLTPSAVGTTVWLVVTGIGVRQRQFKLPAKPSAVTLRLRRSSRRAVRRAVSHRTALTINVYVSSGAFYKYGSPTIHAQQRLTLR